ncbi:malectin domain-containing carbohydrate-binding protein [Maribacter litoralis]|uniref:Invasin-like protein n=1 Tax=Maribacter litoralis TaxID=2059726 RepID=A0A653VCN3_9FLAO|nr:malectin domain-containing carbohydrate-binding protein [Maribacter litoralis]VXC04049.1 Invasin-like protein [Maribacter litoralis]
MIPQTIHKISLITILSLFFISINISCSSSDDDTISITDPDPEPEPEVVVDPTNSNTTIEASSPIESESYLTSIITVQLANNDGTLVTSGGNQIVLNVTGTATISEITDNGDGTYSASVSSDIEESITVSGTVNGDEITDTAIINFEGIQANPAQEIEQSTEPLGPTIIRINSGGPEIAYGDVIFQADQYFEGPSEAYTNPSVTEISETDMDEIFLTERVTEDNNPTSPFSYAIPLTNGSYTVKLYFAEIYWGVENPEMLEGGVGSRVFDIIMEDAQIFTSYDIFKDVGVATASSRMYDIEVIDGELNILFEATVDRPKISAIEIFGNGTITP